MTSGLLNVADAQITQTNSVQTNVDSIKTQPAPKLKNSKDIIRVRLLTAKAPHLDRNVLRFQSPSISLSLAHRSDLGAITSPEWLVQCQENKITNPKTMLTRRIPKSGILLESASGAISINGKLYRDQIVVYPGVSVEGSRELQSRCQLVNHLPVEKYLASVVNSEFNSKWAIPAVEAQVIAARTYALYQMKEARKDSSKIFDVESSEKDQMYLGLDLIDSLATQAVQKTHGLILSQSLSAPEPVKAFYHSTCGGGTLLPQEVWQGMKVAGFTKRVRCYYCANSPVAHWNAEMSFAEIQKKILRAISVKEITQAPHQWELVQVSTQKSLPPPLSKLPQVSLLPQALAAENNSVQGHLKKIYFLWKKKSQSSQLVETDLDAYQARNLLNPSQIKSTWLKITPQKGGVVFEGKGSGHGVGLCQFGAKAMGEKGFSREQILSYYYPQLKISKIW